MTNRKTEARWPSQMNKKFITSGCSFTYGHELSDDIDGKSPSKKSWAFDLKQRTNAKDYYICTATPGAGNSGIARRTFEAVSNYPTIGTITI